MATMTETAEKAGTKSLSHDYHAEAHVLSGHLQRPIDQKIEKQGGVDLKDRRGGHLTRFLERVSVEGLITYTRGLTRVSGSKSLKNNGWVTLATSIVEGLNVFEVITADRIVAQVSTEHPPVDGWVPQVTFLGSQFNNLRVSGFPVTLRLKFGICGSKPAGDKSHLRDAGFLNAAREQTEKIANASGLPKPLHDHYHEKLATINELIRTAGNGKGSHEPKVTCSLVESIGEIPIPGVQSFGHVLVIPEFGSVSLGEIQVGERLYEGCERPSVYFELSTIKMKLGCIGEGQVSGPTANANGHNHP